MERIFIDMLGMPTIYLPINDYTKRLKNGGSSGKSAGIYIMHF